MQQANPIFFGYERSSLPFNFSRNPVVVRVGRDNGRSFTWMTGLIFSIDSTSALSYPLSNLKKYNTLAAHISLSDCIVLSRLWFLCQYSAESYQVVCAVSCKSCKKWQWQLFGAKTYFPLCHHFQFVTIFNLLFVTICEVPQKSADRKALQEKSQNLDIGRATWENGNVSPFHQYFTNNRQTAI